MTLFLTSSPCDDNVPEGVWLPCIFFERNRFVENLRRFVQPGGSFLVVAAYPDDHARNDEMAGTFAGCFGYHGMGFSQVHVLDSRNMQDAPWLVQQSTVILLAGGHVPTQNAFFAQLNLRELLRGYPGVVMGVSAGSMNAADVVYVQPEEPGESLDPCFRRSARGLGLTRLNILPHYQMVKDRWLDGRRLYEDITYEDSRGRSIIVMNDGTYILEHEGRAELYGEAWHLHDAILDRICGEEQTITL